VLLPWFLRITIHDPRFTLLLSETSTLPQRAAIPDRAQEFADAIVARAG
jgi:hypothetical protein